ncbi:MAG: hypothetical protein AAGI03_06000, partial [Pseudomonadota bacterium]
GGILQAMDTRSTPSPITRWREIVHPLFWPVFFWNLRAFIRTIRALRAQHGDAGELVYGVSWWGGIHIEQIYPEPEAPWDAELEGCGLRIRVATFDVLSSFYSQRAMIAAKAGKYRLVLHLGGRSARLTYGFLPSHDFAGIPAGTFPNLPHLDTS